MSALDLVSLRRVEERPFAVVEARDVALAVALLDEDLHLCTGLILANFHALGDVVLRAILIVQEGAPSLGGRPRRLTVYLATVD